MCQIGSLQYGLVGHSTVNGTCVVGAMLWELAVSAVYNPEPDSGGQEGEAAVSFDR